MPPVYLLKFSNCQSPSCDWKLKLIWNEEIITLYLKDCKDAEFLSTLCLVRTKMLFLCFSFCTCAHYSIWCITGPFDCLSFRLFFSTPSFSKIMLKSEAIPIFSSLVS